MYGRHWKNLDIERRDRRYVEDLVRNRPNSLFEELAEDAYRFAVKFGFVSSLSDFNRTIRIVKKHHGSICSHLKYYEREFAQKKRAAEKAKQKFQEKVRELGKDPEKGAKKVDCRAEEDACGRGRMYIVHFVPVRYGRNEGEPEDYHQLWTDFYNACFWKHKTEKRARQISWKIEDLEWILEKIDEAQDFANVDV
jgi:hypothetical protein